MTEAEEAFEQHWYMSRPTPEYLKAKEFFLLGWDRARMNAHPEEE